MTDANGCQEKAVVKITQPERSDWTMGGNAGTNPATQYIGTSDNKDVVFKANGQESVRLKANGDISLLGTLSGEGPIYRSADGTLHLGGGPSGPVLPPLPDAPCALGLGGNPYWQVGGNIFSFPLCEGVSEVPRMGTRQALPLHLITNDVSRMLITADGKVGIGSTSVLETKLHVQGDLLVRGTDGDVITSSNSITGPVLWARNSSGAIGLSLDPSGVGHIVKHWDSASKLMTFKNEQVEIPSRLLIGDVQPRAGYRLFVQEGILTERVKVAIRTESEWSDHVFMPNYRLMSLKRLAAFIKETGHLPGVPSAEQMVAGGLDVAKTDAMLLEKIEEITLHLINMEERLYELEKENASLRKRAR